MHRTSFQHRRPIGDLIAAFAEVERGVCDAARERGDTLTREEAR